MPLGTSTAIHGSSSAASIISPTTPSTSRDKPAPNSASTIIIDARQYRWRKAQYVTGPAFRIELRVLFRAETSPKNPNWTMRPTSAQDTGRQQSCRHHCCRGPTQNRDLSISALYNGIRDCLPRRLHKVLASNARLDGQRVRPAHFGNRQQNIIRTIGHISGLTVELSDMISFQGPRMKFAPVEHDDNHHSRNY